MTTETHTLDLGRHRLSARLTRAGASTTVVVSVDGVEAAAGSGWPVVRIPVAGIDEEKAAVVVLAPRPGRGTVRLVVPPAGEVPGRRPERIDFEPPTGTSAHRRFLWAGRHPRLHAARHVAVAVGQVVAGLLMARIALGFVLDLNWGWLPDWQLPRLPRPDLPDISWPDIDLPDLSLPGWLAAILATKRYWFPILVAIAVAVAEVRRRRRRETEKENAAWPEPSTPSDTQPDGSSSSTPR